MGNLNQHIVFKIKRKNLLVLAVILLMLLFPIPKYQELPRPCPAVRLDPKFGIYDYPCPPARKGWVWTRPLLFQIIDKFTTTTEQSEEGQTIPSETDVYPESESPPGESVIED
ncbi:hypothetical protein A3I50_03530 [Candidatus Roizmanbacteria bacterium RIFCSPLOWO2_02_FULL_37_9]|uniref:Uncharacterized protein n=1 Tax=Candidatus Roizmanbacteria bacterium RIFCSPLOWO2_01_FULL_37_16 TaxID=1802058 RepID=A0A1F7IQB1_9BACT|nr:MAG: hypothetical protein A2859_00615 [Candidatus Roizmanbacteria bacterium RIFCSPHIGHO2_01_FULL_37_16b]OGK31708.1 MAG: hypothetical protein A3F57_03905 [Candidatus Roizmanbacteria bacterium RIFCSPHIGHO2_12_FULL_36_11]OGK45560.1 MAG: hypothetical protein A3B40_01150 [Candidatus Roizmanbacteria bacterium RIFCSPLOWO2_01_FULL_37_16]OGK56269.1 MAG: hypothetical protein A3I50_03530 [Candidatus Roizmanbacteria bacterium RIFCSPLOWO2_02_FULL_37_9]